MGSCLSSAGVIIALVTWISVVNGLICVLVVNFASGQGYQG